MSLPVVPVATRCDCGAEVAPGLFACPGCARLVYAEDLARLARDAQSAEQAGDLTAALAAWRRAIELLPPGALQRSTIENRMKALGAALDGRAPPPPGVIKANKATGARTGAAAGAVGLALLKSKALLSLLLANGKLLLLGLIKLPTLLSMLVYARWSGGYGGGFALGLVACIYVHEVGHVAALRRYGIDASAPMFVPGFGAFVRMKQYPTDAHEEARTGLAGPLWGLFAAAVAAAIAIFSGSSVARSVASVSASINLFNLIPVWQLDGARGMRPLSRGQRLGLAALGSALAIGFHQWMPILISIAAVYRALVATPPAEGDRRVFMLFGALMVAHAILATLSVTFR